MIHIDFTKLNDFEKQIHQTLLEECKNTVTLRISDAASLCGCSVSKISKISKKIGFTNFKQYVDFLHKRDTIKMNESNEFSKIQEFINTFDESRVEEITKDIESHDKIILFGYGPSLLLAQYFEYRLRTVSSKVVIAVVDALSLATMTDDKTLVIIFTATGAYKNFDNIYSAASNKGAKVLIVAQNYNLDLSSQCDNIFYLTNKTNPSELEPYEQSRTLFFIFMEEVVQKVIANNKQSQ